MTKVARLPVSFVCSGTQLTASFGQARKRSPTLMIFGLEAASSSGGVSSCPRCCGVEASPAAAVPESAPAAAVSETASSCSSIGSRRHRSECLDSRDSPIVEMFAAAPAPGATRLELPALAGLASSAKDAPPSARRSQPLPLAGRVPTVVSGTNSSCAAAAAAAAERVERATAGFDRGRSAAVLPAPDGRGQWGGVGGGEGGG